MCQFFSCIIVRGGEVYPCLDDNSHDETIKCLEKLGIKDDKLHNRDLVRIEFVPQTLNDLLEINVNKWSYKVDEVKTLPKWYTKNEKKYIKIVKVKVTEYMKDYKTDIKRFKRIMKELETKSTTNKDALFTRLIKSLIRCEVKSSGNYWLLDAVDYLTAVKKETTTTATNYPGQVFSTSTQSTISTTTLDPRNL